MSNHTGMYYGTGRWLLACLITVAVASLVPAAAFAAEAAVALNHQTTFLERLEAPQSGTVAQTLTLGASDLATLKSAPAGKALQLPALTLGLAKGAEFKLRRIQIRAPGTRTYVQTAEGTATLAPSRRQFFVGQSLTGGLGFSLDPETGRVHGLLVEGRKSYQLDSVPRKSGGIEISLLGLDEGRAKAGFSCGLDGSHATHLDVRKDQVQLAPSMRAVSKGGGFPLYQAVVAVDTDNEFLFNKFGNDTSAARDWIEDMFVAMNAFYEPDLRLRMLLGDLILRVDNSPSGAPDFDADPDNFNAGLREFRSYFQANQSGLSRNFAALLSGRNISSNSFSGVAWVGAYCSSYSYSFNRIGSASFISPAFIAGGVGHELGHNLGSSHTHCEALGPGGSYVDECYATQGCYQGPTSCPNGVDGSLMSYCHAGASGFDGGGPDVGTAERCSVSDYFHPLIIGKLDSLIASRNPSCIADFAESPVILIDGFE